MSVDNRVGKKFEREEWYDTFAMVGVMFAVSYEGAICSLLKSQVLKSCDGCNLKYLCREIDVVIQKITPKRNLQKKLLSQLIALLLKTETTSYNSIWLRNTTEIDI